MDPFIIKIILSFFIAGLWISFATLLAEKFGSKIGGLIANLPSNILIAFIFVALTQGKQYTVKAALSVPLGMTIDAFFLFAYILGLYKNIITGLFLSLLSWLVLATLTIKYLQSTPIGLGIIIYFIFTILIFYVLEKIIKIPSIQKQKTPFNYIQIIYRAIFAGSIVAGTVTLSFFCSPFWTGIFSTFPAVMLSTMLILSTSQGPSFAQAVGKIMIISSGSIVIFSMLILLTYPKMNIFPGTLVSFSGSVVWILLFQPVLKKIS